jgi:hypothetical protein
LVLNLIRQKATTDKLDQKGVARLLSDEQTAFVNSGVPAIGVVKNAIDAGTQAAATVSKYSSDSWAKVRLAPVAAASLVMDAPPTGVVASAKERSALGAAISSAKKEANPSSLLCLAFDDAAGVKEEEVEKIGQDRSALLSVLKDAMGAVTTNSPAEASGYGRMLVNVAQQVAEASKEGGFLGIGGTRVSAQEQAAIDQIKSVIVPRG